MTEDTKSLILLVDDEEKFLQGVIPFLASRYQVLPAASGQEALAHFEGEKEKPLVVVSDQRMPQMTGLQLFEEMSARNLSYLGRILLTGYGDANMAIQAFNQGLINNYLQKPLTQDKIDLLFKYIDLAADEARNHLRRAQDIRDLREAIWGVSKEATIGRLVEGVLNFFRDTTHDLLQRESIIKFMIIKLQKEMRPGAEWRREEIDKLFQRIEASLAANQSTIGQILALFRSTESFSTVRDQTREGFPLQELVQSALASTQAIIISKEIEVATRWQARQTFLKCIPADLYYLFVNILLRAASVADFGGRITVASQQTEKDITLTVSDNGAAPDANEAAHLFHQLVSHKEYDLSLASKIVEKYNGTIGIQRTAAGETTIAVSFPLDE